MNREQAENILEAYVTLECDGGDNKARISLREVILDAMTEYRPKQTWSGITLPNVPCRDYVPKVTCSGPDYTYKHSTTAVVE